MLGRIRRAFLAAVVGALAAALGLVAAYALHPGLVYEMDRELPSFIKGMHGSEHNALGSYAWTGRVVTIDIPGLDRQEIWHCTLRFRGAREAGRENPTVTVAIDGAPGRPIPATNDYQELGINLPAQPAQAGASIVITVAPTFVPGGNDTRELGVQVDRFLCKPESALVRPPGNTLSHAILSTAIFSAGLALLGLSLSSAMFAAVMIGLGQTVLLALGSGMYGSYAGRLPWLSLIIVAAALGISRTIHIIRREALSSTARFVIAGSAIVLFLQMAGLMHPAKIISDAVFNAHRLERVLNGDIEFTQVIGNGVLMPYAIGLYVFAAPWTWLTRDFVTLLIAVTASANVIGGALLYPVMLRAWGDRRAASLAAVMFQLVPHPFTTLSSGNFPNMFGQSMGLAAIAAAVTWPLDLRKPLPTLGLLVLTTWAFCSHVSTITMVSAVLGVLVVVELMRRDPARRRAALTIAVVTIASLGLSWVLFYSRFLETFRAAFTTMFSGSSAAAAASAAATPNAAEVIKGNMTMPERVWDLGGQAIFSFGWPLLLLAAIGVWSILRNRTHDRLTSALIAWATMWVVLSASTVFAPVDAANVRYAAEFLGRINLATVPLIAVLAGRGAATGWDPTTTEVVRKPLQYVAAALMAWTLIVAAQTWLGWFIS